MEAEHVEILTKSGLSLKAMRAKKSVVTKKIRETLVLWET